MAQKKAVSLVALKVGSLVATTADSSGLFSVVPKVVRKDVYSADHLVAS